MNQDADYIDNLSVENEEESFSHPSAPPDVSEKVESWIKGSMDNMSPENAWAFIDQNSDTESIFSERSSDSIVIVGKDTHTVLGSVSEYVESLVGDLAESVTSKEEMEIVLRPVHRVATPRRQEPIRAYGHTRNQTIDHVLNLLIALTFSMALGLGIGNFLGTTDDFPPRDGGCPMARGKEHFKKSDGQKPEFRLSESEEQFLSSFDPKAFEEALEIPEDIISSHKAKVESSFPGNCQFKDTKKSDEKLRDFSKFNERRATADFVDKFQDYPSKIFDDNETPTERRKIVDIDMNENSGTNHNEDRLTEAEFYGRSERLNIGKTDSKSEISSKFQDYSAEVFDENENPLTEKRKPMVTGMKHHIGVNHNVDHLTEAEFYGRSERLNIGKTDPKSQISGKFQDYSAEVFDENENPLTEKRKPVVTGMKHHIDVNHNGDHLTEAEFYGRSDGLGISSQNVAVEPKISDKVQEYLHPPIEPRKVLGTDTQYHDSLGVNHNEEYLTEAEFYGRSKNFDVDSRKAEDSHKIESRYLSKAEFYGKRRLDGSISYDNLFSDNIIQSISFSKSQLYGNSAIADLDISRTKEQPSTISGKTRETLNLGKSTFYGRINNYSDTEKIPSRDQDLVSSRVSNLSVPPKNLLETNADHTHKVSSDPVLLRNNWEDDSLTKKNEIEDFVEKNNEKFDKEMNDLDKRKFKKYKENEKLKKKQIYKRSNSEYENSYRNKIASKRKQKDHKGDNLKRTNTLDSKGRYYSRGYYDSRERLNIKGDIDECDSSHKRKRRSKEEKEDLGNWESKKEKSSRDRYVPKKGHEKKLDKDDFKNSKRKKTSKKEGEKINFKKYKAKKNKKYNVDERYDLRES